MFTSLCEIQFVNAAPGDNSVESASRMEPGGGAAYHDWLLWQLADSAFPTGGFAHSGGMEAAWQHREAGDVRALLETALLQLGHASVPFVNAVMAAPENFKRIDSVCDAFLLNHVANRASRLQGQALLASAARVFSRRASSTGQNGSDKKQCDQNQRFQNEVGPGDLKALRAQVLAGEWPAHFAPIFGVVAWALGIECGTARRLFVFTQLRGWVGSMVRLGMVGPTEAQVIQYELSGCGERVAAESERLGLDDLAQTAPLLDLWQGTQDRLYSRLFQS